MTLDDNERKWKLLERANELWIEAGLWLRLQNSQICSRKRVNSVDEKVKAVVAWLRSSCLLRRRSRIVGRQPGWSPFARRAPKSNNNPPPRAACACRLAGREYSRAALEHLTPDEKEKRRMEPCPLILKENYWPGTSTHGHGSTASASGRLHYSTSQSLEGTHLMRY